MKNRYELAQEMKNTMENKNISVDELWECYENMYIEAIENATALEFSEAAIVELYGENALIRVCEVADELYEEWKADLEDYEDSLYENGLDN